MMMKLNDYKFIFVCGLHRSGTSILFRSLRDHPQISGFTNTASPEDEGMHLQSVVKPSGAYGGAGEFGFHPGAHLTEHSTLITEENRSKFFEEWGQYWDLGKPYLLEKSPPNLIRTRFLQEIFPNSYFLVLLRHPISVTYATRAWYRKYRIHWRSFSRILDHWFVCHEIFRQDLSYIDRVFLIKYENFVTDPDNWLNRIYQFLDLDNYPVEQEVLKHVNAKYFSLWEGDQKKIFFKHSVARMISKYESRLKSFGYSLINININDPVEFLH